MLIIRGDNTPNELNEYIKDNPQIIVHQFSFVSTKEEIIQEFAKLEEYYIVGIGNMVGWGELFLKQLKEHKV